MNVSKYKVYVPQTNGAVQRKSISIANVLLAELANFGFLLEADALNRLARLTPNVAMELSRDILDEYTVGQLTPPLFKNWEQRTHFAFGERVFQIFGYIFQFSGNDFESESFYEDLKSKVNFAKFKTISLASEEEFTEYFEKLAGATVTLDNKSSKKLNKIFGYFADSLHKLPRIKSAEIRTAALLALTKGNTLPVALKSLRCNSLDALRFAAAKKEFSAFKLPSDVKFAGLSWSERIAIFSFLNDRAVYSFEAVSEDMGLNRTAWARFLKHTHFFTQEGFVNRFRDFYVAAFISLGGKYESLHKRIVKEVDGLIEEGAVELTEGGNLVYRTFASRMQKAIEDKDWQTISKLCSKNPSYLLRNLSTVANAVTKKNEQAFIDLCKKSFDKAEVGVLFSILSIDVNASYRVIDVKGNTVIEEANYPKFFVHLQEEIKQHIKAKYGFSGKVVVQDSLKDRIVPFLSKNSELERGTRIKAKTNPFIYFYVHWIQGKERTDLDLSFLYFDAAGKADIINFRNQANCFLTHSGDFTSAPAPAGATEYGRIDLSKIPKGVKYIAPMVNVWAGSEFNENKEVTAGFFTSKNPQFDLKQEITSYSLKEPAQMNCPFVYDVETREILVLDFNQRVRMGFGGENYAGDIRKLISAANTKNYIRIESLAEILSGKGQSASLTIKNCASKDGEIKPEELFSLFSAK